ncbi:MAG: hypothetical protein FWH17_05260 [Oscillospiraceae bacterium]|nr:hypothetical protein [Oscillospiraceae bacterium]
MRIKALMRYFISTAKNPIIIFTCIYLAGVSFGAVVTSIATETVVMGGYMETDSAGVTQSWSISIIAFAIFMLISSLIGSQKDTRFLITRSVSRKEIFASNALFMAVLAGFMSLTQIIVIHIDAFERMLLTGESFRGLGLDIQHFMAANMANPIVFFIVSFSVMLTVGAIGYLFGTCFAKWKIQTLCVLVIGFTVFIACLMLPDFAMNWVVKPFRFMMSDDNNGLWIALKQVCFAALIMIAAFPVARRITAAKSA